MRRRSRSVVIPEDAEHAGLIAGSGTCAVTEDSTAPHTLAILGNAVQPGTAADSIVEALQNGHLAARIVVIPLRAPKHQINLGTRLDGTTVIIQIVRLGGISMGAGASSRPSLDGRVDHYRRLPRFDERDPSGCTLRVSPR